MSYGYLRWFHSKAKVVLTPTKSVVNDLKRWNIKNTTIWPRGVDLENFHPHQKINKNKKPIFINVGRVAIEKNLEAFLNLNIECEKWVVGDGPDKKDLNKNILKLGFLVL